MHGVSWWGSEPHHGPISCNATDGVVVQSVIPGKTSRADNYAQKYTRVSHFTIAQGSPRIKKAKQNIIIKTKMILEAYMLLYAAFVNYVQLVCHFLHLITCDL